MKQQRRLVLHFDINKTILMKDKVEKRTTDAMVILTKADLFKYM